MLDRGDYRIVDERDLIVVPSEALTSHTIGQGDGTNLVMVLLRDDWPEYESLVEETKTSKERWIEAQAELTATVQGR